MDSTMVLLLAQYLDEPLELYLERYLETLTVPQMEILKVLQRETRWEHEMV
jgi:hypothetical protein